jgi:hypothetical protein
MRANVRRGRTADACPVPHRVPEGTVGTVQRSATGNGHGLDAAAAFCVGRVRGSRMVAYSFLQIPPRGGHPCRSANTSPCRVCRGLSPPNECALPGAPKQKGRTCGPRLCRGICREDFPETTAELSTQVESRNISRLRYLMSGSSDTWRSGPRQSRIDFCITHRVLG